MVWAEVTLIGSKQLSKSDRSVSCTIAMQETASINLLNLRAVNYATSLLQLGCVLLIQVAGKT